MTNWHNIRQWVWDYEGKRLEPTKKLAGKLADDSLDIDSVYYRLWCDVIKYNGKMIPPVNNFIVTPSFVLRLKNYKYPIDKLSDEEIPHIKNRLNELTVKPLYKIYDLIQERKNSLFDFTSFQVHDTRFGHLAPTETRKTTLKELMATVELSNEHKPFFRDANNVPFRADLLHTLAFYFGEYTLVNVHSYPIYEIHYHDSKNKRPQFLLPHITQFLCIDHEEFTIILGSDGRKTGLNFWHNSFDEIYMLEFNHLAYHDTKRTAKHLASTGINYKTTHCGSYAVITEPTDELLNDSGSWEEKYRYMLVDDKHNGKSSIFTLKKLYSPHIDQLLAGLKK